MIEWDDLRHFLAVAETGSTLAAGRKLRVSQTTAARRVAGLEETLRLRLFDRKQAGYQLTPEGEALLAGAEAVAQAVGAFEDAAAARVRSIAGAVRLTASEIFAVTFLPPILRDFHLAHPDIRIELDTSDEVRDLDSGAAEIAIRIATSPSGAGVVGRRIADDEWAVYCSRDYAARHGVPTSTAELADHALIGGGEDGVWRSYGAYIRALGLEGSVKMHHNTSLGLLAAVRSGFGLSALPCLVADQEDDLLLCLDTPRSGRGMWLLTHERLRHEPRVRAVIDFLYERLAPLGRARAGQSETPAT
ncbi:LysR family transcriptional regulator [Sphingomonas sp. SUN019]|uniref:LysR family transcriptional regulator n=1 Tax=Sphingomonas sp. SUN019 TaxID=2937788 RepID=UPI0021649671|nr:LysR family transcriptional regulator [Sphingomonas sp. SUN019]UVO52077.1 LysR family transcriptional regulator [Sphingomonas sp. SUN019]